MARRDVIEWLFPMSDAARLPHSVLAWLVVAVMCSNAHLGGSNALGIFYREKARALALFNCSCMGIVGDKRTPSLNAVERERYWQ